MYKYYMIMFYVSDVMSLPNPKCLVYFVLYFSCNTFSFNSSYIYFVVVVNVSFPLHPVMK